MGEHIAWNGGWEYLDQFTNELTSSGPQDVRPVDLPHNNAEFGYNYFDEGVYQKVCGYRKRFTPPDEWKGLRVAAVFEGAAHTAEVYLNGRLVTTHAGGYTAFEAVLSDGLLYGRENVLTVKLDSRESQNVPPFGNVIDYLTYGGLYRGVHLTVTGPVFLRDLFVQAPAPSGDQGTAHISAELEPGGQSGPFRLVYTIYDGGKTIATAEQAVTGRAAAVDIDAEGVQPWSIENPRLYTLECLLFSGESLVDEKQTTFGFRSAEFRPDGFYLNGKKIKIRGLNRHQSFAHTGYAMPERAQRADAEIAKFELGLNAVRTSHYPQHQAFIDACDELGLLVFTELPGWQHIGNEEWQKTAQDHVREMVLQYRNHPSIIIWGVRINESQDDDKFYTETNRIAHALDPTRQTGGVRFLKKSHLLEDVYTYNDFSHTGSNPGVEKKQQVTPDMQKGYLITEYNGHMFPTKAFDNEAHRLEHALRHARVVNGYYGEEDIAGGFGWCMFDYNTHQDFGSGDRICYHGVMDMHRNPKLAAAVYASQADDIPVLEISSSMDIGEHPGGNLGAVYAFTNADSVKLYKNDEFVKEFFPDRTGFAHMPHPPVAIDDLVGGLLAKHEGYDEKTAETLKSVLMAVSKYGQSNLPLRYKLKMLKVLVLKKIPLSDGVRLYSEYVANWGGKATEYRFEAIKDGQVVKTVTKAPVKQKHLEIQANTTDLTHGDTYDVASLRIKIKDQNGNTLVYCQDPLLAETKGPIALLGPALLSLKGGMSGLYVRTTGAAGTGTVTIGNEEIGMQTVSFEVKKAEGGGANGIKEEG